MHIRLPFLLVLTALLALGPQPARAEVREHVNYSFYDVDPGSEPLGLAMARAFPYQMFGQAHHGRTEWHIDWVFDTTSDGYGRCEVSAPEVTLDATITLPRLVYTRDGNMRAQFEEYLENLRTHETGHLEIAEDAAREVDRMLSRMINVPCSSIRDVAESRVHQILDRLTAQESEYDRRTQNGRTQGAYLH